MKNRCKYRDLIHYSYNLLVVFFVSIFNQAYNELIMSLISEY